MTTPGDMRIPRTLTWRYPYSEPSTFFRTRETLLKKWLVEYKFRSWRSHRTDAQKRGNPVTEEEKRARAEEIALILGNNRLWHSHGRMIGPGTLTRIVRLEIDDYSNDNTLRPMIRAYNDLLTQYIAREGFKLFLHSREHF